MDHLGGDRQRGLGLATQALEHLLCVLELGEAEYDALQQIAC